MSAATPRPSPTRGLALAALLVWAAASAARAGSPMHPDVVFLDEEGVSVLASGRPVSTVRTCGACHDAEAITGHGYHVWAGFDERRASGRVPGGRTFDESPGSFGRWDPTTYRRLTREDDATFDLGVADWIRTRGARHVGGGPALVRIDGRRHGAPGGAARETHVLDEGTGGSVPWDWSASGAVEMNCFLCHAASPADERRVAELRAGRFRWASTATLADTGLVEPDEDGTWRWVSARFTKEGAAPRDRLGLSNPTSAHCGACHYDAAAGPEPVGATGTWSPSDPGAAGQVFSPQRLADSALNLRDKDARTQAWDVHAARLLACTDCHHALNDPAHLVVADASRPGHLAYEARRLDLGEYLERPSHDFTKGASSRAHAGAALDGTMRGCGDCHDAVTTHARWLPSARRHVQAMRCEACHVPEVPLPAVEQTDWTVPGPDGAPGRVHRGAAGPPEDPATLLVGYEPVLLPRRDADGVERLAPHHLATVWYWTGGTPRRPVRLRDLAAALHDGRGGWHADVLAALDTDGDGRVGGAERRLDTRGKVEAVRARLEAVGVAAPRIEGSIEPTGLHHGVARGDRALRRCEDCHARDSRAARAFEVAAWVPPGAQATLAPGASVRLAGTLAQDARGRLVYTPRPREAGRYVLGHDASGRFDAAGAGLLAATVLAIAVHGVLRWGARRRREEAA